MEVVINHKQFLDWKYNDKTLLNIKLENLGVKDGKEFENQLILGIGTTLLLTSNIICGFLKLGEMDLLGSLLTSISLNDCSYLVQYCTYGLEYFELQKKHKSIMCTY